MCSFSRIQPIHPKCLEYVEYSVKGKDTGGDTQMHPRELCCTYAKEMCKWHGAVNLSL